MSKTYKKYPDHFLRRPKGRKQALIEKEQDKEIKFRSKAIPPDAWDDLSIDPQAWAPLNVAISLANLGMDTNLIIKKLRNKFKLNQRQAENVIDHAIEGEHNKTFCKNNTYTFTSLDDFLNALDK